MLSRNAIANGLICGHAPRELLNLNATELALCSRVHTGRCLFSCTAGAHKSIRGWHTFCQNDIEHSNKVLNHFAEEIDTKKLIQVVLVGPFTQEQRLLTLERTEVNIERVRRALTWLKTHNTLYKDVQLNDFDVVKPMIIDCSVSVESENSNVERTFETRAVFPNEEPTEHNGGHETAKHFKHTTLAKLKTGEFTLTARSSNKVLRDCEGDNSLLAFPKLFSFGVGNKRSDGTKRNDINFCEHLASRSSPDFQTADFLCVLHNLHERQRMVRAASVQVTSNQKEGIANLTSEELDIAIEKFLDGEVGSGPATTHLQKIKAITSVMGHTGAAAKKARHRFLACLMKFGLPSLMFTITPEDQFNLRVMILTSRSNKGTVFDIPNIDDSDDVLHDFAVNCADIRQKCPGVCAIDFQNVISTTIAESIGWKDGSNIEKKGMFGDIRSCAHCVEEQGELS